MTEPKRLSFHPGGKLRFTYKNYRGEVSQRTASYHTMFYGSTEYHPEEQWIMTMFDLDKRQIRDFAMNDMSNVKVL